MLTIIIFILSLKFPNEFKEEMGDVTTEEILFVVALFEVGALLMDVLVFILLVNLLH